LDGLSLLKSLFLIEFCHFINMFISFMLDDFYLTNFLFFDCDILWDASIFFLLDGIYLMI
jgi:hypothetical protein